MNVSMKQPTGTQQPTATELFTPKLVTVLREGYRFADLKADTISGLTVAIVALPLSMAIAIASGTTPDRGLYTAIVGGFIVSLLGGSRFQIGGPAGAFIVLVAATVADQGIDGLVLATLMSGFLLMAAGFLRIGTYIKFIPYPVTVGFTAGIAVIILASQIRELLGLDLSGGEPGPLLPKLLALARALPTVTPSAMAVAALTIVAILALRRFKSGWPDMLIAVSLASAVAALLGLPIETIGTRFGGIPATLPAPSLPPVSVDRLVELLPHAFAFTLLGAIESLLSAVVADGMTGRRHRSNCELVAQGAANIGSSLFGGICVTGTIARTATNVRAGARGPVSGMLHSLFLLMFMLLAAPLASYIPLSALAGLLAVVAWNMVEKNAFRTLIISSRGDAMVLLATFLITIFRDLTEGIVVGFTLGSVLFISRMSEITGVETHARLVPEDQADETGERYDASLAADPSVVVYRITGVFFFGAASTVGSVLDRIGDQHRSLVIDFAGVPFLDSTAANTMMGVAQKARRRNVKLYITGASKPVRRALNTHGVKYPLVAFRARLEEAVGEARGRAGRA
ncbi:MAG: SulP family inorganic anion transporter [Rhizobiaceae bacterium]